MATEAIMKPPVDHCDCPVHPDLDNTPILKTLIYNSNFIVTADTDEINFPFRSIGFPENPCTNPTRLECVNHIAVRAEYLSRDFDRHIVRILAGRGYHSSRRR